MPKQPWTYTVCESRWLPYTVCRRVGTTTVSSTSVSHLKTLGSLGRSRPQPKLCLFLAPLLGFIQRSPLHRHKQPASTPGLAEANPSADRCHSICMFRPCRSTRLRRFTPLVALQAYCILQSIMGFAMFWSLTRKFDSSPMAQTLRSFSLPDRQSTLPHPFPSRRCLRSVNALPRFLTRHSTSRT